MDTDLRVTTLVREACESAGKLLNFFLSSYFVRRGVYEQRNNKEVFRTADVFISMVIAAQLIVDTFPMIPTNKIYLAAPNSGSLSPTPVCGLALFLLSSSVRTSSTWSPLGLAVTRHPRLQSTHRASGRFNLVLAHPRIPVVITSWYIRLHDCNVGSSIRSSRFHSGRSPAR